MHFKNKEEEEDEERNWDRGGGGGGADLFPEFIPLAGSPGSVT